MSTQFPYDHLFKLLMIGDAGVGKVCRYSLLLLGVYYIYFLAMPLFLV